jgi:uncharacterized repeat protein (TIGR02543 family)
VKTEGGFFVKSIKSRLAPVLCALLTCMAALCVSAQASQNALTRAELCVQIVDTLGLEYREEMATSFTDVPPEHPAYEAVSIICYNEIMYGRTSSTFSPDAIPTRAEVAYALWKTLGCPASDGEFPADVISTDWFAEAVRSVWNAGLMSTDENGAFGVYDSAQAADVAWDKLPRLLQPSTSATPSFDLSNGSISIMQNLLGTTVYSQGDTTVSGGSECWVRQSNGNATANTITIKSGQVTISIANLSIQSVESSISVFQNAALTLNLVGTNTMTATGDYQAGIWVPKSASLTIQGEGSLTVSSVEGSGAGIGSNGGSSTERGCGTVIINSGTIVANGGWDGAGIGGGYADTGGTIIINGGDIDATAGTYGGAGIGGGYGYSYSTSGNAEVITITGGTVTARGIYGAGIGGGGAGDGGVITITGGVVNAIGGNGSAGIGGGKNQISEYGSGGSISITNAKVTASGAYYAIGSGNTENQYGCDSITIGSDAVLTLSHTYSDGSDYQERIFDLELADAAALSGHVPGLTTAARGASGVSYQWQTSQDGETWSDVEGETQAACSVPVTADNDGWYFRCKVTNGFGNVAYTNAARCYVLAFSQQPTSLDVGSGDSAALTAQSTCSQVSYRWERSYDDGATWVNVPGEVYSTLIVNATLSESGALYRCVITAANGDALASEPARITVNTSEVTYTIRDYFEEVDGSFSLEKQTVIPSTVGTLVTAPEVSYEGFTRNPTRGASSGTVTADSGLVLSRYYVRNTYSITFDTLGGPALPEIQARYGADVSCPADPGRYGYTFGGWYADAACTQAYEFTTMPLGGATVYAKWISGDEGRSSDEYVINGILLRDSSTYEEVKGIPTGSLLVEISVTNRSSTHTDTVMLAAYDQDGRMLSVGYLYASVPVGGTFTFGMALDNTQGNVATVKAFVLSALNNAAPLALAAAYTA